MTKTKLAKNAAALIVGFTTAKIVKEIIRNNTTAQETADKVAVVIAGYIMGAIAADAARNWSDDKIDKLIDWWIVNVKDKLPE